MDTVINIGVVGGICLGLTQVIKMAFKIPDNFQPLTALVIAIGVSLLFVGFTREAALMGLIAGLSAMGLWSGTKNTVE